MIVSIKRNADGKTVDYEDELWDEDPKLAEFIWNEGNFACDCNRSKLFYKTLGIKEFDEPMCGITQFSAKLPDETEYF